MITTTTTTKKISTLRHEREREREREREKQRYCRYYVTANPRDSVEEMHWSAFAWTRELVRCAAAAEWDSAHVM